MTGLDLAAQAPGDVAEDAPQAPMPRRRLRLPASRGGVAWLAVLVIVGALVAVQFGRQVYLNWEMGQHAADIERQIAAVEAQNEQLERELEYLRSDAYISTEARRLANLGLPGEQVLIIPPGAEEPLPPELAADGDGTPMLERWVDLFFGGAD